MKSDAEKAGRIRKKASGISRRMKIDAKKCAGLEKSYKVNIFRQKRLILKLTFF